MSSDKRDSRAFEPALIADPIQKAEVEARNGLRQFDVGVAKIQEALERGEFKLRPSLILDLHRAALAGISSYAGNWRPAGVAIEKSEHVPPGAHLVPSLIEELCDYVNDHWTATSLHLAAYCMWRLNWVHPFADGNGRTSRMLSYVILCVRAGSVLPGTPTIPDYIVENRSDYFAALDAADAAFRDGGRLDVSAMERLLETLCAKQLAAFFKVIGGTLPD